MMIYVITSTSWLEYQVQSASIVNNIHVRAFDSLQNIDLNHYRMTNLHITY